MQAFRKTFLIAAVLASLLGACAPGMSQEQAQVLVQTSVAQTIEAQNFMGTSVALTVSVLAPAATATPTEIQLSLPTLTPLPTVTPFVVVSSGGGSGSSGGSGTKVRDYACTFAEVKPRFNVFKPTDPIDVVWIITNTGKKTWPGNLDLDFVSGTRFSPYVGEELPELKSGERVTISFEGNAPKEPGYYEMKFKVEGGLCFPFIDIQVIKPPGSDP